MTDDVVVVGAGVIGLTTALRLAESGLRVRVVTAKPPRATTSAVAGALWGKGPGVSEPADRIAAWSDVTFTEFAALAGDASTGVHFTRGREVTRDAVAPPVAEQARDVSACGPDELPDGFRSGHHLTVPTVYMPAYLDHLLGRLDAAGGTVEAGTIRTRSDVTAPVAVNCAGVAARDLVPDDTVVPVRGQHVVVANPGIEEFFVEETDDPAWISFFPHGDRVVLGGVAERGRWDLTPDPATAAAIVARCAAVDARLADAPVLEHWVGLRPTRPEVRIGEESVGRTRWVHNYGHGGMGVTLSWGCAAEVRDRVLSAHSKR
ncbi:MAG TPA: FAD-dependent oxidoreductase [Pseudonocardiaceae bacterium]|jgi:D-amino-acid oxidase|nr:FAD-dependent oxidoreductase [Pseudonocardiaceae bacterium]